MWDHCGKLQAEWFEATPSRLNRGLGTHDVLASGRMSPRRCSLRRNAGRAPAVDQPWRNEARPPAERRRSLLEPSPFLARSFGFACGGSSPPVAARSPWPTVLRRRTASGITR